MYSIVAKSYDYEAALYVHHKQVSLVVPPVGKTPSLGPAYSDADWRFKCGPDVPVV